MMIVPSRSWYDPKLNCHLHTGNDACQVAANMEPGTAVAIDIETPGLDRAFEINCVTAAWRGGDGYVHAALLDPRRAPTDAAYVKQIIRYAFPLILHNAAFDVPALYQHGMLNSTDINRIVDTLLLARMAWPNPYDPVTGKKDLTSLSVRMLGMSDFADGMKVAFKAAGHRTIQAGYENMDIDSPIYRLGAMADTVATLRLEPLLRDACRTTLTQHPFEYFGATTDTQADDIIAIQETVNRVMLRRTAAGLNVDRDYLTRYMEKVDDERHRATALLHQHGLAGGAGKGAALVAHLDAIKKLPTDWPRTATGKLSAAKDHMATLDHPLATAQRFLADTDKVLGYLDKVYRQSQVTGRCHPQVGVLGASATGRMAYGSPELQQFSADARPIICDDGQGLTSIDWSQIEPVTMGLMAKDEKFLAPYEAGDDLYEPLMRAAGISRSTAKVVLLADMYGQGEIGMASRINASREQAAQIRRQIRSAMPQCTRWMAKVQKVATDAGKVITAGGRILPVDQGGIFRSVNYAIQGSAYDVLAHTICEMERRGIGDRLQLAMHDEVVVDTPVADEVRSIMESPPDFLVKWADRMPVLRTDRADMGSSWQKV